MRQTVRPYLSGSKHDEVWLQAARAFSAIELLVSMSVISVLMAITIPAVLSARDTARKAECQSRVRQLGLALSSFEHTFRRFPVGTEFDLNTGRSTPWRSVQAQLLPYLDNVSLFERLKDANEGTVQQIGLTAGLTSLHCPSETTVTGVSYRVCTGRNVGFFDEAWAKGELATGKGALAGVSSVTPITTASIRDGLSNTAAMSERTISHTGGSVFDPHRDIWMTNAMSVGFDPRYRPCDDTVQLCDTARDLMPPYYLKAAGHSFVKGDYVNTGYNHVLPPNSKVPDCTLDRFMGGDTKVMTRVSADWGAIGARSDHRDRTVSLLLLDGSVRMCTPEIELELWRACASRSDGD
jgi:prepilin-type N-terminal cleavage/methylation domain-containing protein